MTFINTLPYISNPIEEFSDYTYVNWENDIYPQFKWGTDKKEIQFFGDIIIKNKLSSIIDLWVGWGVELSGIISYLKKVSYQIHSVEANEVDDGFIKQANLFFKKQNLDIPIHKANWIDLPYAIPEYTHLFDFAFLTGNSLTYIGGWTREYTKKAQQSVVSKFAKLIKKDGYLFIDSRDYDYIQSLMHLPKEDIFKKFSFDYTVYYHGFQQKILVFPAYISETVVVLHYYDKLRKIWSKLDLYPIYEKDMLDILSTDFEIEKVYYDFQEKRNEKNLFIQYLAKKR